MTGAALLRRAGEHSIAAVRTRISGLLAEFTRPNARPAFGTPETLRRQRIMLQSILLLPQGPNSKRTQTAALCRHCARISGSFLGRSCARRRGSDTGLQWERRKIARKSADFVVLLDRIELSTSSLPMTRSTTELQQQPGRGERCSLGRRGLWRGVLSLSRCEA